MKHINSSLSLLVWLNESVIQHGVVILFVCCTVCYRLLSVCACLSVGCVVVFCAFFVLSFPMIHSMDSFIPSSFILTPSCFPTFLPSRHGLASGWVAWRGSTEWKHQS